MIYCQIYHTGVDCSLFFYGEAGRFKLPILSITNAIPYQCGLKIGGRFINNIILEECNRIQRQQEGKAQINVRKD